MGLIKAALGAASGVMGDQWKEYFYCSALPAEVLAVKGQKKVSGRSSNRHGTENIITDGSIVAVAEGQCALIVEQGKVVELCAEPVIFEELLKKLFDDYGLTLTFEQYVLVGSTVRSYLAYLLDKGAVAAPFDDSRLLWQAV